MAESEILIVGGQETFKRSLAEFLKKEGFSVSHAKNRPDTLACLKKKRIALVMISEDLGFDLIEALFMEVVRLSPDTKTIIVTSDKRTHPFFLKGLWEQVIWPENEKRVVDTVRKATEEFELISRHRMLMQRVIKESRTLVKSIIDSKSPREQVEIEAIRSLSVELGVSRDLKKAAARVYRWIEKLFSPSLFCVLVKEEDKYLLLAEAKEPLEKSFLKGCISNVLTMHSIYTGESVIDRIKKFLLNGKELSVKDIRSLDNADLPSHITFPLVAGGKNLGIISIASDKKDSFSASDLLVFSSIAFMTASALLNITNFMRLEEMASKDPLTGLFNRGHFEEVLDNEFVRAKRYGLPLSAIMLDFDGFKRINDTFGHPAGDRVLVEVASAIKSSIRVSDLAGRFGGEEFIILLPNTFAEEAVLFAERLRLKIREKRIPIKESFVNVTISAGVASLSDRITTPRELVSRADEALLFAKRTGKDRVCLHIEEVEKKDLSNKSNERRKKNRIDIRLPLRFLACSDEGSISGSGECRNISDGGIGFTGDLCLRVGEFAILDLKLLDGESEQRIKPVVQIRWNRDEESLMGAEIVGISETDEKMLKRFLDGKGNNRRSF